MRFLKEFLRQLLARLGAYPNTTVSTSFSHHRKLLLLKKRFNTVLRLSLLLMIIFGVGVLVSMPTASDVAPPHLMSKLHDSWYAEPERMTKDCKKLNQLNDLTINIQPLSHDKVIIYAQPPSEVIPSRLILKLQQAEKLIEGRVFRAIRQSDSVGFNMILSDESDKLTLAFALDEGAINGEYVLSFLRRDEKKQ